jgi:hypothetical protein
MTVSSLRASLDEFFFKPVSAYPAAVYRILFGLCACATFLLIHGDWLNWFGPRGWITAETIRNAETGFRLNLFAMVPQTDGWVEALFWLFFVAAVTLTLGLGTRVSSVIVFLGLNSMNQRMPLIFHGGDIFLRSVGFFLIFASTGAVLSLDSVIGSRRQTASPCSSLISPWPLRLIQIQLAVMYFASFCWKAKGNTWWNGTALYYALHLREVRQFPVPHFIYQPLLLRLGSWSVLAFELLFPLLIWFRPFRKPVLVAGVVFHLCLEYCLNVPMFQWDVLASYVLFLDFGGFWGGMGGAVELRSIPHPARR